MAHGQPNGSGIHIGQIISFAGAFCAFCIGSGFATGQEVMQFFTAHGLYSFGALAISMFLFMWLGSSLMAKGYELKLTTTTDIFVYYCGPLLGKVFENFVPMFLFCVVVIMFSGAGATLQEYYGLPAVTGRAFMAIVSLITVVFGLKRLVQVIGTIGPVIIVISIGIGALGVFNGAHSLREIPAIMETLTLAKANDNWATSGLLYGAFMVFGSAPFFAGIGSQALNKKDACFGGLLGGFALMLAAGLMSTGILLNIVALGGKEVPTLAMVGELSVTFAHVFAVILFLGIYTTAAPMLWSVCNRIMSDDNRYFKLLAVALTAAAFIGGMLPFGQLVGTIYPATGLLGVLFIGCIIAHQVVGNKTK